MRKPRVLFYYPQHFNRTAQGTNPFLDKLLETCDKYGVSYRVYEEPDGGTDKHRNPKARKADIFFWFVWFVRNVVKIFSRKDFYHREKYVAKIVNILTLGYFKVPVYVTFSGSMFHLFASLNPAAKVYDAQHGVLMKNHRTFFDDNDVLREHYYKSNLHWMMWGDGYTDLFSKGEDVLKGRVHTIGYPIAKNDDIVVTEDKVALVSLQYTHDWDMPFLEIQKRLLDDTLSQFIGTGYKVLVRHHPRYNNVIPIDDVLGKYDFVSLTSMPFNQLIGKVSLQVTYNSTTAFEYAQYGIPSVFMSNDDFRHQDNMMYREFAYPLFENMSVQESLEYLQNNDVKQTMKNWYELFYSSFDEEAFLKLVNELDCV